MLKKLHALFAWLGVALGAAHALLTAVAYERFTPGALWFLGAGFAVVFAGFLNLALNRNPRADPLSRALCVVANVAVALLFGAALFLMSEPQIFAGLFLFSFEAVAVILLGRGPGARTGEVS